MSVPMYYFVTVADMKAHFLNQKRSQDNFIGVCLDCAGVDAFAVFIHHRRAQYTL